MEGLILVIVVSMIHFPTVLRWIHSKYRYIDQQLEQKQCLIKFAKDPWITALGYSLEFCKGVMIPKFVESYMYTDLMMSTTFIILLMGYIFNPLQKFKPRYHDWIILFLGILYFLSPLAAIIFILSLCGVMVLTNVIPWSYIIAIGMTGVTINITVTESSLFYFTTALLPLSIIISIQLYEFYTFKKGRLISN
mgnify:CR=1 FL=1|tara:strand:- start:1112 stop:1690 length:579 start_codon:yes stop_codon:yes gene_type:complete